MLNGTLNEAAQQVVVKLLNLETSDFGLITLNIFNWINAWIGFQVSLHDLSSIFRVNWNYGSETLSPKANGAI